MSDPLQEYVKHMTQHQGALRAFIVSLMPGSPHVGDVLQETNLTLWQKREKFQEGSNFLAWAFTIARFKVMQQRDQQKRDGFVVFSPEVIEAISDIDPDEPYKNHNQYLNALDNCMGKLGENERELIHFRYSRGKNLEQLAATQSKSPGALRTSLFRLRAALKKCVEQQFQQGGAS